MPTMDTYPAQTTPNNSDYHLVNDGVSGETKQITREDYLVGSPLPDNTVTTTAILDNNVTYAKLLSTIFSGQVQSQANAGTAGGNLYWINLGGIKLLWGLGVGQTCATGGNTYSFVLPTFFTTVTWGVGTSTTPSAYAETIATIQGYSITTMSVNQLSPQGAQTATPGIFVIGT